MEERAVALQVACRDGEVQPHVQVAAELQGAQPQPLGPEAAARAAQVMEGSQEQLPRRTAADVVDLPGAP